jgi:hypothetical protein
VATKLPELTDLTPAREFFDRAEDGDAPQPLTQGWDGTGEGCPATTDFRASDKIAGRYRILRPYAAGGLGEVSVALDEPLNREVALKQVRRELADDPQSRTRFLVEAEVTGSSTPATRSPTRTTGACSTAT